MSYYAASRQKRTERAMCPGQCDDGELVMSADHADIIIRHAVDGLPDEVCGILAGIGNLVHEVIPVRNSEPSATNYFMDPAEQFRAIRRMRSNGHRQVGIYHSHPGSPAAPSAKDVELAFYPDAVYVIAGLVDTGPELRGYCIEEGKVSEVAIRVLGA